MTLVILVCLLRIYPPDKLYGNSFVLNPDESPGMQTWHELKVEETHSQLQSIKVVYVGIFFVTIYNYFTYIYNPDRSAYIKV